MSVIAEATPNPNAMKFTSDKQIFSGNASISIMPGQTSEYALLNELMTLDAVDNVFGYQHFITVNKKTDAVWDQLTAEIVEIITKHGH